MERGLSGTASGLPHSAEQLTFERRLEPQGWAQDEMGATPAYASRAGSGVAMSVL
jgi:hypothetical protein